MAALLPSAPRPACLPLKTWVWPCSEGLRGPNSEASSARSGWQAQGEEGCHSQTILK